ncbi:hypothetical protein OG21DRAFT_1505505 [Imleria badia]|nr:hypothetical protein OG21DRAFT_1505505 [Imleria badia]
MNLSIWSRYLADLVGVLLALGFGIPLWSCVHPSIGERRGDPSTSTFKNKTNEKKREKEARSDIRELGEVRRV